MSRRDYIRIDNPFHTIDFHHHTALKSADPADWDAEIAQDYATRTATMDPGGIDEAVLLPGNNLLGGGRVTERDYNEFLARYRFRHADRFPYAFATANPLNGRRALEDMEHAWKTLKLDGFVWHHRMFGVSVNHASMEPLWALAQDLGAPCAVHIFADSRLESPWRLEEVAERYPKIPFLALDGFSSADQCMWMPLIARRHPNIWFDTGALFAAGEMLFQFMKKIDFAPRLFLGTDNYPGLASRFPAALVEVLAMEVSDEVKAGILGGTLKALLARYRPG